MRFMVFVKSNAQSEAGVLPDEKMLSEMGKYNEELMRAGAMLAGDGLKASSHGARVVISAGKPRQVDGPFAETKELVGGYWLLQFASLDEAVSWLKRAPFPNGEVEIRPVHEAEDLAIAAGQEPSSAQRAALETPGRDPATQARIPGTKRFLSLLKADKHTEAEDAPTPELLAEMGGLLEEMGKQGVLLSGEGLRPSREGARIRYDGDKRSVIDGPFTESKELVAGVTLMQTRSLAEALDWSRRCLEIHMRGVGIHEGEIEVRAMLEMEDFPVDPAEKPDGWRSAEQTFRDHGPH